MWDIFTEIVTLLLPTLDFDWVHYRHSIGHILGPIYPHYVSDICVLLLVGLRQGTSTISHPTDFFSVVFRNKIPPLDP